MSTLTRRGLLRGAAAGAIVVGWDPAARSWATARGRRALRDVPDFDGVFLTDPLAQKLASDDYGHFTRRTPTAVLRPASVDDVVKVVDFARRNRIGIVMRGQAHSGFGQAQSQGGIVIDSATLCRIHEITGDRAVVEAGVLWRSLITEGALRGVTPPALTDYQLLSVGGVLSMGGVDSGPMKHGAIVDNVLELVVVTGEGDLVTCSPARNRNLFDVMRAGLGQCGIIVRATLRMVPAPAMAMIATLRYDAPEPALADMAALARDGRFDAFEAITVFAGGRWGLQLQAATYFDPPAVPATAPLLDGLEASAKAAAPAPYLAWTARIDTLAQKDFGRSKVLYNPLLPEDTGPSFLLEEVFSRTPDQLGSGLLMVMGTTRHTRAPLLRLPDSEVFFAALLLRMHDGEEAGRRHLADNRRLYDRQVQAGGKRYPWDAVPDMTRADWKQHYGPRWGAFKAAKERYDPAGILGGGAGVFA